MKAIEDIEFNIHKIMCLIGGFMGTYGVLNRAGQFGSAQTINLIHLLTGVLGHNYREALIRLGALLLYILAIQVTVFLQFKTKVNLQKYCLLVHMVMVVALPFIPLSVHPIVALYPVFFMMSTQWAIFQGAKGYRCSTIFSTNNIKQTAIGLSTYMHTKDRASLEKGLFFLKSLIWFHMGVILSFVAIKYMGLSASFCCVLPIIGVRYLLRNHSEVSNKLEQGSHVS